jgi:glyoxylase-like metal-dependent hydrolase (beta-lactamase superfamily II)
MRQVLDGVYEWSWFSTEKQMDFNGHLVLDGSERVMIDPPPLADADRADLERLGRVTAIVLTNRDHVREIAACRHTYGATLFVPAADAPLIDVPADRVYDDGDRLPGGLAAIWVPDAKSPGESALWWPRGKVLIVGDAVIGHPAGALRLLPDERFADVRKARHGLHVLLEERYEFDAVLVGDGVSIPVGGREALRRVLAQPTSVGA